MDILSTIGGALGSVVTGGLTGLLGIGVQRFFDMKNKQLDLQMIDKKNSHEIALRKVDAEIVGQEWAARTQIALDESKSRIETEDSKAFAASFNEPIRYSDKVKPTGAQGWALVILDFIRGIVRPGLTMYLCILTTLIYFESRDLLNGHPIAEEKAFHMVQKVIDTVLYLTTTCLLWWFGVRNKAKAPKA